jgi:hypothetical protein
VGQTEARLGDVEPVADNVDTAAVVALDTVSGTFADTVVDTAVVVVVDRASGTFVDTAADKRCSPCTDYYNYYYYLKKQKEEAEVLAG